MADDRAKGTKPQTPSAWVGWISFVSVMMMLLGIFHFIVGLTATTNSAFFSVVTGQLLYFNLATWGWIHIILGVAIFATGFTILNGNPWGRTLGIVLASISAIANLADAPSYPIWAMIVIAFDVFVIYALTIHGHELMSEDGR